jgi:hypothetical protein
LQTRRPWKMRRCEKRVFSASGTTSKPFLRFCPLPDHDGQGGTTL